jgi:hypothetical protein
VILGSVLAFFSVVSVWIERQALNTDDWVKTSKRLLEREEIRSALSKYLVDQLYENVDVEKEVEEILPGETKDFAGPVSGGLRSVGGSGAERLLESSTALGLWEDANRTTHEQLLAVLENKTGESTETENGEVTLNVGSLVTNLADQIGFGGQLAEKLPPDAGHIVILHSEQLKTAQDIAAAIKGLALILSLLTLLSLGLAIYLSSESRWVTVLFCGIGLVAAGFGVIVFRHIAGGIIVDQLVTEPSVEPAAEATWSIATSLLTSIATTVIVYGVLFGVAGWLASPTSSAQASRRALTPALRDHAPYVYAGLGIVVCIYFLSAPTQNLRSFLTALVLAAFAAFGIHELRRQSVEEFPDAQFSDTFGRTRDRVVGAVRDANLGERASKLRLPEVRKTEGGEGEGEGGPASTEDARLARLERLGELREKGVLSDEEFRAEKERLLNK